MSNAVAGVAAPATPAAAVAAAAAAAPEMFARDAMIAWFRGEFAAANAIIDALCSHISQITGGGSEYEAAFAAIHRRRMNWIPVIQMQRFYSIADVSVELRRVAAGRAVEEESKGLNVKEIDHEQRSERSAASSVRVSVEGDEEGTEDSSGDSSDHQKVHPEEIVAGTQEEEHNGGLEDAKFCFNHEECATRQQLIKTRKGFVARESVKGHMVNVVKGLKVYEDMFTESELFRLSEFISELRLAGHKGELSGETFIYFNKQMKGNKREIIQLGVPLFQPSKEDSNNNIEPIPAVLETVIDHLTQWRLIPEGRRPNSCIVNFFDEEEYSQPYFKPPHLDNPISTLVLSDTTLAFGRILASDPNGNYKGSLTLPLKEGSLLVMRGNSADMARHVICPSDNRRVSITFVRVRPANNHHFDQSPIPSQTTAMTLWQPGTPQLQKVASSGALPYGPQAMVPSWGLAVRAPLVMFSPSRPMVMGNGGKRNGGRGGTGVFLPWAVGPKKYTKHLPPRIQKRRLPSLPSPIEAM